MLIRGIQIQAGTIHICNSYQSFPTGLNVHFCGHVYFLFGYLFNLVLMKIEAVAANESDSGIGAVTFGDSVRDLNRQRAKMSMTVQIDALRIEKQQLEVENARFRVKRL